MSELMNLFTPDKTVEMTHTEYAALMREAVKAELLEKAVEAEVPAYYLKAMIPGKPFTFEEEFEEEKETNMGEALGAIENLYKSIKDRRKLITVSDILARMQTMVRDFRVFEIEREEEVTSEEVRKNEQTDGREENDRD